MTSGPPCWWMRIALGIASPWVDGLIGGARGASLLGRSFAAGRLLTSTLHRREARFLHFQALMVMRRTLRFIFSQFSTAFSSAIRLSTSLAAVAGVLNPAIGRPMGPQRLFRNSSGSGGWLMR